MEATTTLNISSEELEKLILEYLESKNLKPTSKVKFLYGKRLCGYGPTEGYESYFDGCSVNIETKL